MSSLLINGEDTIGVPDCAEDVVYSNKNSGINATNVQDAIDLMQPKTDAELTTESKAIVGAVNELNNSLINKADKSAIPTKTSELTNDSGFITNSTRTAVVQNNFMKITIPTNLGDKVKIDGVINQTVNIATAYGNGYLGDFTITIPTNARPSTGFYDVQLTCKTTDTIAVTTVKTVSKSAITGWIWSPISGSKGVDIYVSGMAY